MVYDFDVSSQMASLTAALDQKGQADRLILEALKWTDRRLTENEVNSAWRRLSGLSEREYLVTSYLDPSTFFETGQAQDAIQLQKKEKEIAPPKDTGELYQKIMAKKMAG